MRELVEARTGKAATVSSDLAHALDAPKRALTAALNARIIARITALIAAMRQAMERHAIAAPLMIVKGDGTLASAEAVALRPIETILSGPAASVIGAKFLSGLEDFVIADIGGTTTDIAVVEKGWPRLDRNGARVGGRQTLVRAIDMRTFGLGGDSEVGSHGAGELVLLPGRVVPLSLLASRWPVVLAAMRAALADPEGEPHAGRFVVRPFGAGGAFVRRTVERANRRCWTRCSLDPRPMVAVAHGPSQQKILQRLVGLGLLAVSAFTPSDAAHVLEPAGPVVARGRGAWRAAHGKAHPHEPPARRGAGRRRRAALCAGGVRPHGREDRTRAHRKPRGCGVRK